MMSIRSVPLNSAVIDYITEVGVAEPELLRDLRRETAALPDAQMQIGPDQGRFMRWLVELIDARLCLEIGVYTGYSSISIALGMREEGRLVACDISEATTAMARRYWLRAGVEQRIQLELRPAQETLAALAESGHSGRFDFAFIDADKESLDAYYESCYVLLRVGGILLIDNTLWSGRAAKPEPNDRAARCIDALNRKVARDERVSATLLPIGDGLTLVRKR